MRDEERADSLEPRRVDRFQDLVAWQKARALVREVNAICEREPLVRRFSFRDQLQRAAVSVMSNVAEGYDRGSRAEFFHMLSIAKGSCAEVASLLYVAVDAHYIDQATFDRRSAETSELAKVIGGLRSAVGRQRDAQRTNRR